MTDGTASMSPTRTVCYADGPDLDTSRDFYTQILGMDVAMGDPVLGLVSPVIRPPVDRHRPAHVVERSIVTTAAGSDSREPPGVRVTEVRGRGLRAALPLGGHPRRRE